MKLTPWLENIISVALIINLVLVGSISDFTNILALLIPAATLFLEFYILKKYGTGCFFEDKEDDFDSKYFAEYE